MSILKKPSTCSSRVPLYYDGNGDGDNGGARRNPLPHAGDGSIPYLSLSWAHTWLKESTPIEGGVDNIKVR